MSEVTKSNAFLDDDEDVEVKKLTIGDLLDAHVMDDSYVCIDIGFEDSDAFRRAVLPGTFGHLKIDGRKLEFSEEFLNLPVEKIAAAKFKVKGEKELGVALSIAMESIEKFDFYHVFVDTGAKQKYTLWVN